VASEAGGQAAVVAATAATRCRRLRSAATLSKPAPTASWPCRRMCCTPTRGCYVYYLALAAAVELPICIQNYSGPVGTPMVPELLARMWRELPHVEYIKK